MFSLRAVLWKTRALWKTPGSPHQDEPGPQHLAGPQPARDFICKTSDHWQGCKCAREEGERPGTLEKSKATQPPDPVPAAGAELGTRPGPGLKTCISLSSAWNDAWMQGLGTQTDDLRESSQRVLPTSTLWQFRSRGSHVQYSCHPARPRAGSPRTNRCHSPTAPPGPPPPGEECLWLECAVDLC